MKNKTFSITEVIKLGFAEFKEKPLLYASVALTQTIVISLLPLVLQDLANSEMVVRAGMLYPMVFHLANLVLQIWGGLIFSVAVTYFFLKIVDHPRTKYEEIFRYHKVIRRYISLLIQIYVPAILLILCFIIPGVIWLTRRSFALYFLLEEKITAKEAIEKSKEITRGNVIKLILIGVLFSLISVVPVAIFNSIFSSQVNVSFSTIMQGSSKYLGFALSSILSLVVMPVATLSSVYIYKILQGKKIK